MASAAKGFVVAGSVVLAGVVAARVRSRNRHAVPPEVEPAREVTEPAPEVTEPARQATEPDDEPTEPAGEATEPGDEAEPERPARDRWSCECGQEFEVTGLGRHRVYWLVDAAVADPVLDGTCPSCERPLPAGREAG